MTQVELSIATHFFATETAADIVHWNRELIPVDKSSAVSFSTVFVGLLRHANDPLQIEAK
jgi:hypothetical protein